MQAAPVQLVASGNTVAVPARRSLRLSARVTLFYGITALFAGVGLTVLTYTFTRTSLLDQARSQATLEASNNAREILIALGQDTPPVSDTFNRLGVDGFAVHTEPRLATRLGRDVDDFPAALRAASGEGRSGWQIFDLDGDPYLGVAIYIVPYGATYFEAFPLEDTERTLRIVLTTLVVGAALTTMLATFFGWSTSRRLLRPLSRVADAAGDIASGALGARLEPSNDPDLDRLAGSFNDMADAVQTRIEREARFASDVSHELRSPITALTAAVEVLDARREDLPDRTQQALDVVVSQVRRFDAMVIDLLELSRLDAGATELHAEDVDLPELCARIAARYGHAELPIEVQRRASRTARLDKVRFERILGNLLDNADNHAGGPTRISIEPGARGAVHVVVEDAGPGVGASERQRIFERFARGSAARHRIGTGLGLALVAEHAHALGGDAWVEDRPGGGARFVVRFPVVPS